MGSEKPSGPREPRSVRARPLSRAERGRAGPRPAGGRTLPAGRGSPPVSASTNLHLVLLRSVAPPALAARCCRRHVTGARPAPASARTTWGPRRHLRAQRPRPAAMAPLLPQSRPAPPSESPRASGRAWRPRSAEKRKYELLLWHSRTLCGFLLNLRSGSGKWGSLKYHPSPTSLLLKKGYQPRLINTNNALLLVQTISLESFY